MEKDFEGRPSAWFFGCTHCTEVCPTTLFQMSEHLKALGGRSSIARTIQRCVTSTVSSWRTVVREIREWFPRSAAHQLEHAADPSSQMRAESGRRM
ncbi:SCO family protein [Microvirga tunisiensis]